MRQAADLLGVSDDTLRRRADAGRLRLATTKAGHRGVDGAELARLAREQAGGSDGVPTGNASARNRLLGIVTSVTRDAVMAQVEAQCGPHRIVSLISREAADELCLEPGVVIVAAIKATNVTLELAEGRR